jgi:hypothetical protein
VYKFPNFNNALLKTHQVSRSIHVPRTFRRCEEPDRATCLVLADVKVKLTRKGTEIYDFNFGFRSSALNVRIQNGRQVFKEKLLPLLLISTLCSVNLPVYTYADRTSLLAQRYSSSLKHRTSNFHVNRFSPGKTHTEERVF